MKMIGAYDDDDLSDISIEIEIPFTICKYLDNAVAFYSKFDKIEAFQKVNDYNFKLMIKYNDEWVVNHFNGPLNCKYSHITVMFHLFKEIMKCDGVKIGFGNIEGYNKTFYPIGNKLNYKDVDMFHEIRENKENLIVIRIPCNSKDYKLHQFNTDKHGLYLWQKCGRRPLDHVDFIGPKIEENEMIEKLKSLCKIKEIQNVFPYS